MSEVKLFAVELPKNVKFVAFYGDGSGAELFSALNQPDDYCKLAVGEDRLISDLEEMGYCQWIALPDNFELWFEIE